MKRRKFIFNAAVGSAALLFGNPIRSKAASKKQVYNVGDIVWNHYEVTSPYIDSNFEIRNFHHSSLPPASTTYDIELTEYFTDNGVINGTTNPILDGEILACVMFGNITDPWPQGVKGTLKITFHPYSYSTSTWLTPWIWAETSTHIWSDDVILLEYIDYNYNGYFVVECYITPPVNMGLGIVDGGFSGDMNSIFVLAQDTSLGIDLANPNGVSSTPFGAVDDNGDVYLTISNADPTYNARIRVTGPSFIDTQWAYQGGPDITFGPIPKTQSGNITVRVTNS